MEPLTPELELEGLEPRLALTVFAPAWGLPSISPQCSHTLALLHLAGLRAPANFELRDAAGSKLAPRTALPMLEVGGRALPYGHEQLEALGALGLDLDAGLGARERADSAAYVALLEDALGPALLHSMWLEQANYEQVVRPVYAATLPFPLSVYHPWQMQRRTYAYLARRGLASATEVHAKAVRALDALSVRLGARPFFGGERPGALDAAALAYLVTVQRCPLPVDGLRRALYAYTNLTELCDRLMDTYFADAPTVARLALGAAVAGGAAAAAGGASPPPAAPPSDASSKKARERQRSRRFIGGAVGVFCFYVLGQYLPVILSAIADTKALVNDGGALDDDDDDDDDDE
ncbi:hypothetical protein T492DRAFT_917587 [Pavlovales sp. CCMP2436]|nr:hypothetical protein T492DRAFT_917587 [Pavlovales sp. CCMP2436]|mmetsp:Transcript_8263/g.21143  ORF Transcript_8263/g.21143 Transcript_8263/m.21143 type:complete len:349 (-) Transcript_8263:147-1193(-)